MHPTQETVTRRGLLTGAAGLAAASLLPRDAGAAPAPSPAPFSFVHLTDTHIQPELGAKDGVKKAFAAIRALPEKPAFALVGGDIIMDAAYVDRKRADLQYDLWREAAESLGIPLHYSVGNHDVFAIGGDSALPEGDPDYGKRLWMKRLGLAQRFGTFDHGGWRFVTLDSVGVAPGGKWWGEIDSEQMKWLDDLLRKTPKQQPVVFLTHVPVMTLYGLYTAGTTAPLSEAMIVKNGKEFKEMIQGRNVKAVFQGHTHVVEDCAYLGTRYITGGAVCGDWWKGPRLGVHPEGFGVVTVRGDRMDYRYVPYGWKARPAPKPAA